MKNLFRNTECINIKYDISTDLIYAYLVKLIFQNIFLQIRYLIFDY